VSKQIKLKPKAANNPFTQVLKDYCPNPQMKNKNQERLPAKSTTPQKDHQNLQEENKP
jgi:hypothetical protein